MIDWFYALSVAERVSFSSAIIALCALMLTLWQGYISRRHNLLSVKPVLTIFENYSIYDPTKEIGLFLLNKGLGPAEIFSVEFYAELNGSKTYFDNLSSLCDKIGIKKDGFSATLTRRNDFISNNEAVKLLWRSISENDIKAPGDIDALKKIGMFVRYKCIYGKKYSLHHKPDETLKKSKILSTSLI